MKCPKVSVGYIFFVFFCLLISETSVYAANEESDSLTKGSATHHDIQQGKRIFNGLVKTENKLAVNCASCHNINYIDTLNWNPSAYEIAISTALMDSATFKNKLNNPITNVLSKAHETIGLNDREIELIRMYLAEIQHTGLSKPKPNITRLLIFIAMFLVFGWSFTDLLIIKKIDKKYIHTIILLITTVVMMKILIEDGIKVGRSQDYAPLQPIKFSHVVHAAENQIDCQYCHHSAEEGKSAGIPSANVCLNCHTLVREGTNSGRFEIDKIHTAIDSLHPIEWVRVHRLPDFVYFNHSQHVKVGKLDCNECHGNVEEMDVVKQYSDLSMGWCLDCHRTRKVQFFENEYYETSFKDYHDKIVRGEIDSVTVEQIGGTDCMKCHY